MYFGLLLGLKFTLRNGIESIYEQFLYFCKCHS